MSSCPASLLLSVQANQTPSRFVGKTGGEIFHEMMLRHGVKHICALLLAWYEPYCAWADLWQLAIPAAPFSPCSMPFTTRHILTLSSRDMNREPAIWPKAMPGHPESPASSW